MSTSPIFTGVSSYASDLQQVMSRALSIAALPLQQYQNQLQDMNSQASALSSLDTQFTALQSAIQSLDSALGPNSYTATSSAPDIVSASAGSGAFQGSVTLDVTSVGSYTSTISHDTLPAVTDPYSSSVSSSQDFTLTVDGQTFQIHNSGTGLVGLAQAINAASAGVQASVINTGNSDSPSYRLVLRGNNLGPTAIQLNDGAQDLLDTLNTGTMATYQVNGLPTTIQSNSRTVTLGPGLTVDLLQTTTAGQPVTISVGRDKSGLSSAISAFVDAYNAVVDALDKQVGKDGGALSGQSIISSLFSSLRGIM